MIGAILATALGVLIVCIGCAAFGPPGNEYGGDASELRDGASALFIVVFILMVGGMLAIVHMGHFMEPYHGASSAPQTQGEQR